MKQGKIYRMSDFYAVRNHAAEQGREFESYLKELTDKSISLDVAIDNAHKGISVVQYENREERNAKIKIGLTGAIVAGLVALIIFSRPLGLKEVPKDLNGGLFGGEYIAFCGFSN